MRAKTLAVFILGVSCGLIFLGVDLRFGVRVRVFDAGLVVIAVLFAWHAICHGVRRDNGVFLSVFAAFALYLSGNALMQSPLSTAFKESLQLFLFAIFFLSLTRYLDSERSTRLFILSFFVVLWCLALHNAGFHAVQGRFAGWKHLGDQKLTHGVILVLLAVLMTSPLRPRGYWPLFLVLLAIIFLFLSGERKGWVAAAAAILPVLLLSERGRVEYRTLQRSGMIIGTAALVLAAVIMLAPYVPYLEKQLVSAAEFVRLLFSDIDNRTAAETTRSNAGRLVSIELALHHLRENPVFGLGPERFRVVTSSQAFLPIGSDDLKGVHNELLRIGAELGYVGLGLYAVLNLVIVGRCAAAVYAFARLTDAQRLRVRLALALFLYGFVVNVFLAGGGLNTFFVILPAGLVYSVSLTHVPVPERLQKLPLLLLGPLVRRQPLLLTDPLAPGQQR